MGTPRRSKPANVARPARRRRATKPEIAREAVETLDPGAAKGSFLDLANRYCGSLRGPKDLASNPKYLSNFGR